MSMTVQNQPIGGALGLDQMGGMSPLSNNQSPDIQSRISEVVMQILNLLLNEIMKQSQGQGGGQGAQGGQGSQGGQGAGGPQGVGAPQNAANGGQGAPAAQGIQDLINLLKQALEDPFSSKNAGAPGGPQASPSGGGSQPQSQPSPGGGGAAQGGGGAPGGGAPGGGGSGGGIQAGGAPQPAASNAAPAPEAQAIQSGNTSSAGGKCPAGMPQDLWQNCQEAGQKTGVDPYVLAAQMEKESQFGKALGGSPSGGDGLMQVEPGTRQAYAGKFQDKMGHAYDHNDPKDQVAMAGVILADKGGDTTNQLQKYNGGDNWTPGTTDSYGREIKANEYAASVSAKAEQMKASAG